jgi:hypothetical protein
MSGRVELVEWSVAVFGDGRAAGHREDAEAGYSAVPKALPFMRQRAGTALGGQPAQRRRQCRGLYIRKKTVFIQHRRKYMAKCLACMHCTGTHFMPRVDPPVTWGA